MSAPAVKREALFEALLQSAKDRPQQSGVDISDVVPLVVRAD